jgi:gamma-glutamyl-gamma-aminobutyrate hydrolase PuuD
MTSAQPLRIGLSARILHDPPPQLGFRGKTLQFLEQSVAHWIMRRGALVFMVPTLDSTAGIDRSDISMRDYVAELDGLVLQGGADVSPESYGKTALDPQWQGDRVRDLYEIDLLWEFVFQSKPVLGICRGAQLINVAFGGTLVQDIPTLLAGAAVHNDSDAYDQLAHDIVIENGSGLARVYPGTQRARVSSIHHQAVDRLGNGLVVEARSPDDGVIEAIRWSGSSEVVGVQWHPEFHKPGDSTLLDGAPLLMDFLRKAASRRSMGPGPAPFANQSKH